MSLGTKPYKGSRDLYPQEKKIQDYIFSKLRKTASNYAFEEYDGPLLESFDLYAAKTGQEIVEKQLYSFEDRGGRKVAIRPEMTPTLARMVAARLKEIPQPIRWFSVPNLWRYERPQKGRLREHWQFNVDILGGNSLWADIELLMLAADSLISLGAKDQFEIKINDRRIMEELFYEKLELSSEQAYDLSKVIDAKEKLKESEFSELLLKVCESEQKVKEVQEFLSSSLSDLAQEYKSTGHLESVLNQVQEHVQEGIFVFAPDVMRGLDYYTGIVFEAFDKSPENNRAIFGGGRYDNLMDLFGKESLSGVGFGLGDVVLKDFLETHDLLVLPDDRCDVYVTFLNESYAPFVLKLVMELRKIGLKVQQSLSVSSFKSQLKQANRSNSRYAILFDEKEFQNNKIVLKNMMNSEQKILSLTELKNFFASKS